jgi:hypothetical protein
LAKARYCARKREIIGRVTDFMKNEAEEGVQIPIANFKERILKATGIGKTAYESTAKEKQKIHSGEKNQFSTPQKGKSLPWVTNLHENVKKLFSNCFMIFMWLKKGDKL